MYVSATQQQIEGIFAALTVTGVLYTQLDGNVNAVCIGNSAGWLAIAVTGDYPVTDLTSSEHEALEVTSLDVHG